TTGCGVRVLSGPGPHTLLRRGGPADAPSPGVRRSGGPPWDAEDRVRGRAELVRRRGRRGLARPRRSDPDAPEPGVLEHAPVRDERGGTRRPELRAQTGGVGGGD